MGKGLRRRFACLFELPHVRLEGMLRPLEVVGLGLVEIVRLNPELLVEVVRVLPHILAHRLVHDEHAEDQRVQLILRVLPTTRSIR